MMKALILIGIIFLFLGIVFILLGFKNNLKVESGGGIFIGPLPLFGIFSSKGMFYILLIIAILIFILFLIKGG